MRKREGGLLPPSPMRMFFIELRHFVISSIALFFSDGMSSLVILSLTDRTRSCGVFGLFDRLNKKAMPDWSQQQQSSS